ncbi:phosphate ABC transporter substrate-binding protein [Mesorhizobium sp. Root157]|uniref:phosphate/phosphite/phosphonate ABC transporter substrate-binding protein n=1 Tax=Mesorhizobium sp. Root157 TaxID=1736477 RepID=UPI0006F63133|nr:PhnD/SsuA/transferrin family substrate-binding protein [Mesorhizobium sp. Root157]KQZ81954.1 phosphate ABC transporter substrate-binding protein [Mesorhizobium sp. Root157]
MSGFIAALPMYDWPELRARTDAFWSRLRATLRERGIDAPRHLVRRNADLPAAPGGIRDMTGEAIAADPATLPPDDLDVQVLWRHPALLLAQTCWGPMEFGLSGHVQVIGQANYDGIEGGDGELYSSAIVIRSHGGAHVSAPSDGHARIPLDLLRGKRFIYNDAESMSGINALKRDLEAMGESLALFSECAESGGHRVSIRAVAEGRADVAAIDCRSWALARRFEPAAAELAVVGWTGQRKGLPFISSRTTSPNVVETLREVLATATRSCSSEPG